MKSRQSNSSLNRNSNDLISEDNLSWYSSDEEEEDGFDYFNDDDLVEFDIEDDSHTTNIRNRGTVVVDAEGTVQRSEDEDDDGYEEEVNSATFIMNQKSLVDKAPGALQHSFAHRTVPLESSFEIRLFQFISVFVICFMTAGIPFGLPALRQLLVEAGIYGVGCGGGISAIGLIAGLDGKQTSKRVGCSVQEGRLAIFQISGWVSWMIGGWLAARCVQHLGPRSTGMIGCGSIMIGALILAVSMPVNGSFLIPSWLRMYILPVMIMSVGSSFSFLACLHYVRLFPKRTSLLHSAIFLAQDLSAFIFYIMYESREFISLRYLLLIYAFVMFGQVIFWRCVYPSGKIPTIRFTVTTWHQRPLLVDKSLPEHIASPYFYLALLFTVGVFLKIYFYMCTFQVQLRILLIPTKRQVNPEDFTYRHNEQFDENGNSQSGASTLNPSDEFGGSDFNDPYRTNGNQNNLSEEHYVTQFSSTPSYDESLNKQVQFFSHVPFFAEQPGGTSSNNLSLRQFIYNPMQPEIFLTDLQEMMYLLIPIASLITIFWMRTSMSDRKISTSLLFSLISLVLWGFVQYKNQISLIFKVF